MKRAAKPAGMVAPPIKPFTNGMRSPLVAPLTRGLIGLPLIILTTHTDKFFAWTIASPMTAAFLGANYWSSALLAFTASREAVWARGRISISVALAFAPLTTAATLIHIHQFHLHTFYGWFWVVAYALYPPMLILLLIRQLKLPGGDPPRGEPVAGWVLTVFAVHAVVLIPLGVAMFAAPTTVGKIWPWALTPLTGQVIAAWLLAFGVMAAHAIYERDFSRVRVGLLGYPFLGLMQVIALLRFGHDLTWHGPRSYVYLAFIASTFVLGAYGWAKELQSRRTRAEDAATKATDTGAAPAEARFTP
jgi:hypothetical protein